MCVPFTVLTHLPINRYWPTVHPIVKRWLRIDIRSYSVLAVRPIEKSSVITNGKSTFPMSLRWTAYVAPKPSPTWQWKNKSTKGPLRFPKFGEFRSQTAKIAIVIWPSALFALTAQWPVPWCHYFNHSELNHSPFAARSNHYCLFPLTIHLSSDDFPRFCSEILSTNGECYIGFFTKDPNCMFRLDGEWLNGILWKINKTFWWWWWLITCTTYRLVYCSGLISLQVALQWLWCWY